MTENDRITLAHFEQKISLLLHEYKQLQERNCELVRLLEEAENNLVEARMRCTSLEADYSNLKQAKIIAITSSDTGQVRERLSRLVREIDRCIGSLKK